jgi:hypothetical protein
MLTVSAMMLSSSTYAWFTMNKEVTVTGMEVKTKVGDNLLIAQDTLTSTTKQDEANFKTSDVDLLGAVLEPASTIDGKDFYYTDSFNVGGNGAALNATYKGYNESVAFDNTDAKKAAYDSAFMTNYGTTIDASTNPISKTNALYGYVDYVFQLKANNTSSDSKYLNVTSITLTQGDNETDSLQAFRTAIFAEKFGATTTDAFTASAGNLVTILSSEAGTAGNNYFTNGQAVANTAALGAVTRLNSNANLATVAAGATEYYKVVVRLWIEGEDEKCNNSVFNTLTDRWALSLKIEMKDSVTAPDGASEATVVNKLGVASTATKTDLSTATISTTASVIEGVNYYAVMSEGTQAAIGGKDLYADASAWATAKRVYMLDGTHLIDVTNQCKLPTAATAVIPE